MHSSYRPPFWLLGRHLQTIVPAAWLALPEVEYRREEWVTPDGDFIELDWLCGDAEEAIDTPLVVLFHGLEGNSQSHYAIRLMAAFRRQHWRAVVVHFRGCGSKPNALPRGYHCGDSSEIDWILRRMKQSHTGAMYAIGVSLGGNALLKWLGEQQQAALSVITKAIAISAPLALPTTGHVLGSGFNRLYAWLFLKTLRPKALAMIARHRLAFDAKAIKNVTNLWQYDDLFTAPLHGFKNADDYWEQSNSRPYLKAIQVPTLLVNAQNDPFLPAADLPVAEEVSASVVRDFPEHGGHAGFMNAGMNAGVMSYRFTSSNKSTGQNNDWLAQRVLCFLQTGR